MPSQVLSWIIETWGMPPSLGLWALSCGLQGECVLRQREIADMWLGGLVSDIWSKHHGGCCLHRLYSSWLSRSVRFLVSFTHEQFLSFFSPWCYSVEGTVPVESWNVSLSVGSVWFFVSLSYIFRKLWKTKLGSGLSGLWTGSLGKSSQFP